MDDNQKEINTMIREMKKAGTIFVWKILLDKYKTDYRQRGSASTITIVRSLPNSIKNVIYDSSLLADDKDDGLVYTPAGTRIHYKFIKRALETLKLNLDSNPSLINCEHYISCY